MKPLRDCLAEKGFEKNEDTLVISFELRRQDRSVIRINGHAVPRSTLQQIGRLLVDIHGQSQHLSLLDTRFHLDFLDAYAHNLELRREFAAKASEHLKVQQEIKALDEERSGPFGDKIRRGLQNVLIQEVTEGEV